jgi:hypothetical protein
MINLSHGYKKKIVLRLLFVGFVQNEPKQKILT